MIIAKCEDLELTRGSESLTCEDWGVVIVTGFFPNPLQRSWSQKLRSYVHVGSYGRVTSDF